MLIEDFLKIVHALADQFRRRSRAIVITRSSLLSSLFSPCKNFNVAYYSKSIKGIDTKLGILAQHDKLQDKGHNSKIYIFGVDCCAPV